MTDVLKNMIVQGYVEIFKKNDKNARYAKYALIAIVLFGLSYGGFHAYRYYISKREAAAQKQFSLCMKELEQARSGIGSWHDVEVAFKAAYRQSSQSQLAPYILTFEAEALSQQGKDKEAIAVFSKGLEKIKKASDLYGLYSVKLALMKLDMKDAALQQEGIATLEKIACVNQACEPSSGTAVALYMLGSYYWDKNNMDKAKQAWQKLVSLESQGYESPYIRVAQEKLEQIA